MKKINAHLCYKKLSKKKLSNKKLSNKKLSNKKLNNKKLNKSFKTGGKCLNASDETEHNIVNELLYFVIIKSSVYTVEKKDTNIDILEKVNVSSLSSDNVIIYCINKFVYINLCNDIIKNKGKYHSNVATQDALDKFEYKHIVINGEGNNTEGDLLNVMIFIAGFPGYLLHRNEDQIQKYTLLINVREPSFINRFNGVTYIPNYYQVLSSSDEIPTQFLDADIDFNQFETLNAETLEELIKVQNDNNAELLILNKNKQKLLNDIKTSELNLRQITQRYNSHDVTLSSFAVAQAEAIRAREAAEAFTQPVQAFTQPDFDALIQRQQATASRAASHQRHMDMEMVEYELRARAEAQPNFDALIQRQQATASRAASHRQHMEMEMDESEFRARAEAQAEAALPIQIRIQRARARIDARIDARRAEQARIDAQIAEQARIDAQIAEQARIDAQIAEQAEATHERNRRHMGIDS